jgi:DNA replication protein DnaC
MILEQALEIVTKALAPESLSTLQVDIFRKTWNKHSYHKIASELNHEYSYIKDVGADLWKLLSQAFGLQVTKLSLQDTLRQYSQQAQTQSLAVSSRRNLDWGEAVDVSQFCGRKVQLDTLEQWVLQNNCRLITIAGMGGMGKTMLVTQLAHQLAETDQFDVVIWRSLRQAPPLVDFLSELMQAIAPDQMPMRLDAIVRQLLEQLRGDRCLLILDNVEAVLCSNELVGTYRPGYEGYGWLFQQLGEGQHRSTVLLASREIPTEIAIQEGNRSSVRLLRLESLAIEEGKTILAAKGLIFQAEQAQELIERYQGNPLVLEIVATLIKDLFDSNVGAFLTQETLLSRDVRDLLRQHLNRLSSLEWQVMYWLASNHESATAVEMQANLVPPVSQVELWDALVSLDRRSLLEKIKPSSANFIMSRDLESISYTQQPMVMEYVMERLIEQSRQDLEYAQMGNCRAQYSGFLVSKVRANS